MLGGWDRSEAAVVGESVKGMWWWWVDGINQRQRDDGGSRGMGWDQS